MSLLKKMERIIPVTIDEILQIGGSILIWIKQKCNGRIILES